MKNPLETITSIFKDFPGIGQRQAERFTYFLLGASESYRKKLAEEIIEIGSLVSMCPSCFRYHTGRGVCPICGNKQRNASVLMIVAKDTDLTTIEKSHAYDGLYFVLGGNIPLLEKKPEEHVRLRELKKRIETSKEIKEIIFALNLNPEGEYTREVAESQIKNISAERGMTISILGRGLSTGTEIEYSDSDTLKNALLHRTRE